LIKGYLSPEFFCDRIEETETLLRNIRNGADTTLISPRKYGKTGLVYHLFDIIQREKMPIETLYVDIFATRSMSDFIKVMAEAVLKKFPEKSAIGSKFLTFIKSLRPVISYDTLTGIPQIQINYQLTAEKEHTLGGVLEFIDSQGIEIVLAIDEFQQITEYPEKNIEALLRTHIQQMHNTHFIFCGSKRTIMTEMFLSARRPFFSSSKVMSLGKIDRETYKQFIKAHFEQGGMSIDADALEYIMDWTQGYTFYTQTLCNAIYGMQPDTIGMEEVKKACVDILEGLTDNYLQYRELVTPSQWNFLIAVAKEGIVEQLTSTQFLSKYNIGGATSAKRMAKSLSEKELLLPIVGKKRTAYQIYDIFFLRWIESNL
jgi:AAA+ ATPase superfamily predicted ATPase